MPWALNKLVKWTQTPLFTRFYLYRYYSAFVLVNQIYFRVCRSFLANPKYRFIWLLFVYRNQFLTYHVLHYFAPIEIVRISNANHFAMQHQYIAQHSRIQKLQTCALFQVCANMRFNCHGRVNQLNNFCQINWARIVAAAGVFAFSESLISLLHNTCCSNLSITLQ